MTVAQKSLVQLRVAATGAASSDVESQRQIAYCAATDQVWVLSARDRSITLLDGTSGDVVKTIRLRSAPQTCALDSSAGVAYVPLSEDEILLLEARTGAAVKTVHLPAGSNPCNLVPVFERQRLYVCNYGRPESGERGTVGVLDTRSNEIVRMIPVGFGPFNGKTGHDRIGKLYFANRASGQPFGPSEITVVDDATEQVINTICVGRTVERLAHWPQRGEMYAANLADNTVSAIDIATDTVVATIPVGDSPYRLGSVESINGRDEMWVLNGGSWQLPRIPPQTQGGQICVIGGAQHAVVRTIEVCDLPAFWAVRQGYCYIPSTAGREMSIVDMRAGCVVGSVKLAADPVRPRFEGIVWSRSNTMFLLCADGTVAQFGEA